ncbi:SAC3 family protein A-like isoform X2 [Macadamia integrifolia]|uniref:SAC3 family protein A-like isoform X2 n=1 Tax=Macadamia integrifolia TaxID=60698 RepID=UPI001C4F33B6|nr:SAC3 family protein A-like isoform X2 [Macadamia integrifolia]
MMNQVHTTDTVVEQDPNLLEQRQIVDSSGQASASLAPGHSFLPSATGSTAVSWTVHITDNSSSENGLLPSSSYHHNQHTEPLPRDVQDGLSAASNASTSSNLGAANGPQEYAGYSSYTNSADPYGYGNTGYQHGYYYQYPQQANHSYSQQGGVYQNSGAPYQPLTSFQNTGPASYTSTYYNAADYQTTGGYPSNEYNNQTNSWNAGSYAHYPSHQYSAYSSSDSNGAQSSSAVAATPLHYQQQYKSWAEYYSQTDVNCAPGTENIAVTNATSSGCAVPGATGGYPFSNGQPPPPGTTSWRPEPSSSEFPPLQASDVTGDAYNVYWKHGTSGVQSHVNPMPSYFQKPLDQNPIPYDSTRDQQNIACPQGSNLQYSVTNHVPQNQVPQNYQPPLQTFPSLDTRRVSKLQIPTNPRIASNLGLGLPKTDKDSSTTNAATKPAYIGVSMPKPTNKVPSHDDADSMLKPGMFPASLRAYVERALSRCKEDSQKAACQNIMKEMITKASADGTLLTRDWDIEPLFPLPDVDTINKDGESSGAVSSLPRYKRSPSRRTKSRWEPISEEKLVEKVPSVNHVSVKEVNWDHFKERDGVLSSGKCESTDDGWNNSKLPPLQHQTPSKNVQRPVKKQRLSDNFGTAENGGGSSDSDKEQGLAAYYSSAITLANSPEERKRRENRSKRFEKAHGHQAGVKHFRQKAVGAGSLYSRRASVLELSRSYNDSGSRAVEDIDWDAFTVKGTCQEIEKRYLRLTSAPDPATVRPEEVLEKALLMVLSSQKNYLYKCDQLKSIRQDLTVQRIRNELTVKVYETHARLSIEAGDLPEYNQCQSQLQSLYAEGIKGCHMEFSAYNLLCAILHSNNNRDLLSSMARLSDEVKKDEAVKHALAVRAAVTSGNYVLFFRLYKLAPNLNTCLMDLYVEKMRFEALKCMSRSYRPTLPVAYIAQVLGFTTVLPTTEGNEEKDMDGFEECEEWLRAHGACLTKDNSQEMQLDTKASSSSLYMPEPEDAVAHGDTNLAVIDFLTRTS